MIRSIIDMCTAEKISPIALDLLVVRPYFSIGRTTKLGLLLVTGRDMQFRPLSDVIEEILAAGEAMDHPKIGEAMRSNLSLRGEMHHYMLSKHFPKKLAKVDVQMEGSEPVVKVAFTNGHEVATPEATVLSDEFLALCVMMHDLPSRGRDDGQEHA